MKKDKPPVRSRDSLPSHWKHVPDSFQYLQSWASRFGTRGLTVYFGKQPPLTKLASPAELCELATAYETIDKRRDAPAITAWCLSTRPGTPANEAKECIRGLLLLFERLADRGLSPFNDGRVRFVAPDPPPFDWGRLPPHLTAWLPWLKKFESLATESELFDYALNANGKQMRELAALKALIDDEGDQLRDWCMTTNVKGNPARNEAFKAEWLFVLADFADARIKKLS